MAHVRRSPGRTATHSETRVEYAILCDSAQTTQDGKLYLLGGGWSHIFRLLPPAGSQVAAPPTQFAIAASFLIDWLDANRPISVRVGVEHQDEKAPLFEARAQLTAGRPSLAAPGDPLRAVLALPVLMVFPQDGSYCVRAEMEGAPEPVVVRFQVGSAVMAVAPPSSSA